MNIGIKESARQEPGLSTRPEEQLNALVENHERVIRYLRQCADDFDQKYHDLGSSDFVIGLMEQHEKMRWMLESFRT